MKRSLVFAVWLCLFLILSLSVISACTKDSADLNGDGNVDSVDSEVISSNYGRESCELYGNNWCSCSDINQDGKVDLTDFSIFAQKYSSECIKYSADLNFDGNVDMEDHGVLAEYYGDYQCSLTDDWCGCADINQDDVVDLADYVIFVRQYNSCGEGYILEGDKCVKQTCEQIGGDVCRISLDNADNLGDGICENYGCWKCEENYIWDGSSCVKKTCEQMEGDKCDISLANATNLGDGFCDYGCWKCNVGFKFENGKCVEITCEQSGGDYCGISLDNANNLGDGICDNYGCWKCNEDYTWNGIMCLANCDLNFGKCSIYTADSHVVDKYCLDYECRYCNYGYFWMDGKCNKKICVKNSGDLDFDGDVDLSDSLLFVGSGERVGCDTINNWCDCIDINWDGEVNSADFNILSSQLPKTEPADDGDTETNGNGGTSGGTDITTNCEDRGYYCMRNSSCQIVGGSVLGYDCVGSLVCCNRREKIQETCVQKEGEICDIEQECEGGMIVSSFDLGYGERCCIEGTCERKVYVSGCEQNHGNCRDLCNENEEETSYDCDGGNICCIKTVFLEQRDGYWKILSFVFLSLFAVAILVAIIIKKERKNNFPVN